jgi:aminopeptidase YwaD
MRNGDTKLQDIFATLEADAGLWSDFTALCDCGGRRAGTESEEAALQLARTRLGAVGPRLREQRVAYAGWRLRHATMRLADGSALTCNPLLGSQPTSAEGLTAQVVDVGRGTPEDFERRSAELPGRIVLVRHEYPFSPDHIHRRRKLAWAMERGASGFIIANPIPGTGPVSGSSGRAGGAGIPAVGTDSESAAVLASAERGAALHLKVTAEDYAAETSVPILEIPGNGDEWVVLSAHIDGHDLAESAMDNGTGVAAALAVARAGAPHVGACRRGLRVCLFSAEEWALAGSSDYLDRMTDAERGRIALNVNLDTVAGDDQLTALTSEFPQLEPWVQDAARAAAQSVSTYAPTMANSDHYNFARHGIPALRVVAGFHRPESNVRYILTRADTRDKVGRAELIAAARLTAALVWQGLTMSAEEAARLRKR